MVEVALRFLIEQVGQVEGVYPSEGRLTENFLLKRTASHGIELLGILAFHASPIWILAALADAAGGGRTLIHEISQALKEEGLLDPEVSFDNIEQILDGLEKTSGHLAGTLNLPPMDVAGLRTEWSRLKGELQMIPPRNLAPMESVDRVWHELKSAANEQGRSVFMVSSLLAVSTVSHLPANVLWLSRAARSGAKRTGKILGEAILDHYTDVLADMGRTGFVDRWTAEFRPYLRGAAEHFAKAHESSTERLLRTHRGRI